MPNDLMKKLVRLTGIQAELEGNESDFEKGFLEWFGDFPAKEFSTANRSLVDERIQELGHIVAQLFPLAGRAKINAALGKATSRLVQLEKLAGGERLMQRMVGAEIAELARSERRSFLSVNPGFTSTKVCWNQGLHRAHFAQLYNSPDAQDNLDNRVHAVVSCLDDWGVKLSEVAGIACRCGYVKPVPSGTYRVVPEMLEDLTQSEDTQADNFGLALGMKLTELAGRKEEVLLTTCHPLVSDELPTVERITGLAQIKRQGITAHNLNHKSMHRLVASIWNQDIQKMDLITAHLGGRFSFARHEQGSMVAVVDTFSGIPATRRSGTLDTLLLVRAMESDELNLRELRAALSSQGGLLSLSGTDDLRVLLAFRQRGANREQQEKIGMVLDSIARQIVSAILRITGGEQKVRAVCLTGGLTLIPELVEIVESQLADRFPLMWMGASLAEEGLAAALIRGFYRREEIKDYPLERDRFSNRRMTEDRILDAVIFERPLRYKTPGAPIVSADEIIDAACISVREKGPPVIAIVGADNEEALLACKRANEEGRFRIAKFLLVGDFGAISEMAYELDLVIDNDNYQIIDCSEPVNEAVRLFDGGRAQILMKGSLKTETILKGVFHYLKETGKIQPGELISHVVALDIPTRNKLLLVTDAAVNPYPDEKKKIQIIENALKVARSLNIAKPKVALISAVENVNQSISSSIEAEKIATLFQQRKDCVVEGPLSFDVAVDSKISEEKHYRGKIQGTADILVMPDIDAANVLYKTLTTQSGATAAGIILAGNMPLVLTSRGDSSRSKLTSLALAVKYFLDSR